MHSIVFGVRLESKININTMTERITKRKEIENFIGIFLYLDETKKDAIIRKYNQDLELNNNFISECENLIGRKLTKKEIKSALAKPSEFSENIKEIIIDTFQFPKAKLEFNLNALGLTFDNLEASLNILSSDPLNKYLIDGGGKVVAEPKYLKEVEDDCKIFTKNTKQSEIYTIAKTLKESANALIHLGVASEITKFNYQRGSNNIVIKDITNKLKINYSKLLSIN